MKKEKQLQVAFVIALVLGAICFAVDVILTLAGVFNSLLSVIFLVVVLIFGVVTTLLSSAFVSYKKTIASVRNENHYLLGVDTAFYNYSFFEDRVNVLNNKIGTKKEAYILAFSGARESTTRNLDRNDVVKELNAHIASFMKEYFKGAIKDKSGYCFYHGLFLVYRYCNESDIRSMISIFEAKLYEIVREKEMRIYVQPFFGYTKVDFSLDLIECVDRAITARNASESKFEIVTEWNEDLIKKFNLTQVEEIKHGLDNNEFVVYYQPKFNLKEKKFTSYEALVRWNSSKFGFLSPAGFLETATNSGLIHYIDIFVLKTVCADLQKKKKKGRELLPVSVNFSMFEFYSPNFLQVVKSILDEYKVDPGLIQIEITETTSQVNIFLTISIVKKLKEMGIKILMDDFGVGYANIDSLMKIPFDAIKIDKSFIDRMANDVKTQELLRFLINLCKINELEVIAEGVDSIEQVNLLDKMDCDTIQGYYYSKPLPIADMDKFIASNEFEKKGDKAK